MASGGETEVKMEVDEGKADGKTEETAAKMEETVTEESAAGDKAAVDVKKTTPVGNLAQFRVKVSGLPRFYTPTDPLLLAFKKLLHDEFRLDFKYIRSPKKGNSWLYITFYNQINQERALELLRNYKWQGRTLICTLVVADVLKRKQEDTGPGTAKKARLDIPIEEQMLMSTIPYHTVSYDEQLSKKNEEAECLFKWLAVCMEKKTPQLIGYIDQEIAKNPKTKLPFKLDEVRPSPVIDGYRNKCEFRIGLDPLSKKVVVGYRVDNQEDDIIAVAPPDSLRHLPKEMIDVVKAFEKYVQKSEFKPQVTNHDPGVWRLLHVRINKAKQLMVVVLINPTVLTDEQLTQVKQDLVRFYSEGEASNLNIVSVYLHTDNDVKIIPGIGDKTKRPQGQLEHLWGDTHMEEPMLDMRLDIDPNFYFQNNTWGAEVLYKALVEVAGVDDETTVLDLCCGSGGMGVTLARHCKEVIGIEVMDVNVNDAKRLAAKNGLTNCEFLQGSVDDLFPELQERLKGKKVVPVLDPPRVGISKLTIVNLRSMKEVDRLIYIGSNHKPPVDNLLLLANTSDKTLFEGLDPFVVKHVVPVDSAPHTLRCELIVICERLKINDIPKSGRRSDCKLVKTSEKKKLVPRKKHWSKPDPTESARSGYFPTEVMLRRYSSSKPVNRQEIDYQKRDSLYPPPLRGALYHNGEEQQYYSSQRERSPDRYRSPYPRGYQRQTPLGRHIPPDLARYSAFRRDLEDALDESTYHYHPGKHQTSRKLAYANALLEEGIRIASEVMENDNSDRAAPTRLYDRRPFYRRANNNRY